MPTPRPLFVALLFAGLASAPAHAASDLVISQVYGGGGNSGATLTHDFIELFNRGATPIELAGHSVQYASANGPTWQVTTLPSVTLQPGQFFLIQQAKGSGGSQALPAADTIGTIAMSASSGKVALVSAASALSGTCPTSGVLDLVGFGSANCAENQATPVLSNTTAALRTPVCADTDNNTNDFVTGAPTPRNSASTLAPCGGGGGPVEPPTPTLTPIPAIQGSGAESPLVGQQITTSGVVTKLNNNGYYLQDPLGDGDDTTSDGIFVFTGGAPTVQVGDLIRLSATVSEFKTGTGAAAQANPVTQLTGASGIETLATGLVLAPIAIPFPEAVEGDLERYEGMLVRFEMPLTASQNFFQGRYGQVTLSADGRLEKPTNRHPAGSAEALVMADDNARRRIILDDGTTQQNPNPIPYIGDDNTLRAGDTVTGLTGVIDYGLATNRSDGLSDYRIHPTEAPVFQRDHPRPPLPAPVGGNISVASFNVLNYFSSIDHPGAQCFPSMTRADCRGADSTLELARQRAKIVDAIQHLDADVVGLMEIENNGETAVQDLVDALNQAMGASTWASVGLPVGGTGDDAIRQAMIYQPARLARVGDAVSDTDAIHSRPPLAQTFAAANGEQFSVVVNHFKSKGSCPDAGDINADQGDMQGCWNALRTQQAQALRVFAEQLGNDVLVIGDLNAYGKEDPILEFTANGYVDELARYNHFAYTYVFDGEAGTLDHALASASLSARVSGATAWHINADEPSVIDYNTEFKPQDLYAPHAYRSSDHDPVLVGLNLVKRINGTAGRDVLVGTAGDDILYGGPGADKLTGNGGRDVFVYTSMRDAMDVITDFTPGMDRIDLSQLLAAIGYGGGNAIADGYVRLINANGATSLQVDSDGPGGRAAFRPLLLLQGVGAAQIDAARDLGL